SDPKIFQRLRQQLVRWSQDHCASIEESRPKLPDSLNHRELDNWCPLFQIANEIGGKWPARAESAARSLSGQDDTPTLRTELLEALAKIYDEAVQEPDGFLKTAFIVEQLNKDKEAPWSEWKNGMTAHRLGKLLREFKVKSKRARHGGPKESGYY